MNPGDYLTAEILNGGGFVGLCGLFVLALARGWLVTAREHNDVKRDRDEWKSYAKRGLVVAERGTQAAEIAAGALDKLPTEGRATS